MIAHNGFSDENANGITMKNLLSGWAPEEKAEFYCDVQPLDSTAAASAFRVTDMDMLKALLGRGGGSELTGAAVKMARETDGTKSAARSIPGWLKKTKHSFAMKWVREGLRVISPWGHRALDQWIDQIAPDVIVYMVGDSLFLDHLVVRTCERLRAPLVLYQAEAYRIIHLQTRRGLEKAYCRCCERSYAGLADRAALILYNCTLLRLEHERWYGSEEKGVVAYNGADFTAPPYQPDDSVRITYFGNLGVGRSASLIDIARTLREISASLFLDIYGSADEAVQARFAAEEAIRYHGFLPPEALRQVIAASDILVHAESFDADIIPKLRYAFSTKIAQCLRAGRCLLAYLPEGSASAVYLQETGAAAVATSRPALRLVLAQLQDGALRAEYAARALAVGQKNHDRVETAQMVRNRIGAICGE